MLNLWGFITGANHETCLKIEKCTGKKVAKSYQNPNITDSISAHADLSICHVIDNIYVCSEESYEYYQKLIDGINLIKGKINPHSPYPFDVAYNVLTIQKIAFLNKKYTDEILQQQLNLAGFQLIHVAQGYAACTALAIGENAVITADRGIAKACINIGLDVLYVESEPNIKLDSFPYGFIGGSAGGIVTEKNMIDEKYIMFTGNIYTLQNYAQILKFLEKYNCKAICLNSNVLHDVGGILPIFSKNVLYV